MLDSSKRYKELQDQVKRYQKYAKPQAWLNRCFMPFLVLFLISFVLVSPTIYLTYGSLLVIVLAISVVLGSLFRILERKSRIYQLASDEWLVYYSLLICDSLEKSTRNKKAELKREHQKTALEAGRNFLAVVRRNWFVGNFKIARLTLRAQVSEFKSNLKYRVLPALEKANDQDLRQVHGFFYDLAFHLDKANPSVVDLERINKNILVLTSREEEIRKKRRGKVMTLKDFVLKPRTLRHLGVVGGIFLVGAIVYLCGLHFDLVSKDGAFVASIAFMGILVAGYLDYLRKEKTS